MSEKHVCQESEFVLGGDPAEEYDIVKEEDYNGKFYLKIRRFTDKEMVLDGEAESEGEEMFTLRIRINFCPFCGKMLG